MQKGFKQVNLEGCVSGTLAVPVIGENGNWFIGNDDTGVYAKGAGEAGADMQSGSSTPINLASNEVRVLTITLPTAYSDTDYVVTLGNTTNETVRILFTVKSKTTSSFDVAVYNSNTGTSASCSFDWITKHN